MHPNITSPVPSPTKNINVDRHQPTHLPLWVPCWGHQWRRGGSAWPGSRLPRLLALAWRPWPGSGSPGCVRWWRSAAWRRWGRATWWWWRRCAWAAPAVGWGMSCPPRVHPPEGPGGGWTPAGPGGSCSVPPEEGHGNTPPVNSGLCTGRTLAHTWRQCRSWDTCACARVTILLLLFSKCKKKVLVAQQKTERWT